MGLELAVIGGGGGVTILARAMKSDAGEHKGYNEENAETDIRSCHPLNWGKRRALTS